MQWIHDPSQSNVDNLNNVRRDASRHFKKKKRRHNSKVKLRNLSNSRIKNIRELYRGINDFNKGYQLRNNIVKDEKGGLVTYSYTILVSWRNYISQLWNYKKLLMTGRQK